MHRLTTCLSLFALLPALAAAECRYTAERNFDVPAAGLATVGFDLGSSDLVIEGVSGLNQVEVRGRACASDPAWLDQLTVDQRHNGNRLDITPHNGHDLRGNWTGSNYAYVDLRVRMPAKLAAAIRADSGDARVADITSLEFDTSSGDLEANHITGELGIEVSSGDVRGRDIGSVDVRSSSSGDIVLHDVHGPVSVARVGSGDLSMDGVASVSVGSVGSGDVWVGNAAGDVTVESIGSGDVRVDGVNGNFRVGSKGSGDVSHRNVRGSVSVPDDDD
jgi:hypothetical protein